MRHTRRKCRAGTGNAEGILSRESLQGQQPMPGAHPNPSPSFPVRETLGVAGGCLSTPHCPPGSTTGLEHPPVMALLAQNNHPHRRRGRPARGSQKKPWMERGRRGTRGGLATIPSSPGRQSQAGSTGASTGAEHPAGTRRGRGRRCQVGFMRCGALPPGSCCTPAAIQLWETPSAHPAPNLCPEHPGAGAFQVPVAMETASHRAGPG